MYDTLVTRFSQSILSAGRTAAEHPSCLVRIHPSEGLGELIELTSDDLIVGREAGCDLQLCDDSVSRRHARLETTPEGCWVVDMGSTNGVYVNDLRVERQQLAAGDRLRLGNQIFRFLGADRVEAEYHEAVFRMMTTDGLTQAHNKRYLLDVIEREVLRARRTSRPLSVLMFDVDRFKTINDTYGHLAGDEVLSELCRRARGLLRQEEVLARYGGEEFALLLTETPLAEALTIAERLRCAVADALFHTERADIPVTISIGVAQASGTQTAPQLLQIADQQLYAAKRNGRNRVVG